MQEDAGGGGGGKGGWVVVVVRVEEPAASGSVSFSLEQYSTATRQDSGCIRSLILASSEGRGQS